MDRTYPGIDEPVVLTAEKVIIDGVSHAAVLTGKRILLVPGNPELLRKEITLASVRLATAGESSLKEPVITLALADAAGESQSLQLIFVHNFGSLNVQERDKYLAKLKELGVPVITSGAEIETGSRPVAESQPPGPEAVGDTQSHRPASEWMPSHLRDRPRHKSPGAPSVTPPGRSRNLTIGIIIVIIVAVIGVAVLTGQFSKGAIPPAQNQVIPATAQEQTPVPTTIPAPVPTEVPVTQELLVPVIAPTLIVPSTGVWVRIDYPGNYVGYVGAKGRYTQVNTTGEQLYQIPEVSGVIDGSIEKQDGSSETLSVDVFRDGMRVSGTNTTTPFGVADLHVSL